jgi:hypothetical protein
MEVSTRPALSLFRAEVGFVTRTKALRLPVRTSRTLCGHGHFDLSAYDAYLAGRLEDPEFSESEMEAALARLPETPALA